MLGLRVLPHCPAGALDRAATLLGLDAGVLGSAAGLGWASRLLDAQGVLEQHGQSVQDVFTVPQLGAVGGAAQLQGSTRIDARAQPLSDPLSLSGAERVRLVNVPRKVYPRRGLVGVLASRPPRGGMAQLYLG